MSEETQVDKYRLRDVASDEDVTFLRQVSDPVTLAIGDNSGNAYPTAETKELIQALKDYANEHDGLGMAAIQLGQPQQVFVMRTPWNGTSFRTIINPKIKRAEGTRKVRREGCFSVPTPDAYVALVGRYPTIYVDYVDENGEQHEDEMLVGMEARIFQHEYDHLQGKLLIDEPHFVRWATYP